MCIKCCKMKQLVQKDKIDLKSIEQLINNKSIELYAGNCFPSEILHHRDKGNHYTINIICKCMYCNKYYYIGFCLYGRPVIKLIDKNDAQERISRFEWGILKQLY